MDHVAMDLSAPRERLNNREAANYLGLAAATLSKWRCHGDGPPFIKVGRLVRYRRADLDAFLQAGLRLSTSDPGVVVMRRGHSTQRRRG